MTKEVGVGKQARIGDEGEESDIPLQIYDYRREKKTEQKRREGPNGGEGPMKGLGGKPCNYKLDKEKGTAEERGSVKEQEKIDTGKRMNVIMLCHWGKSRGNKGSKGCL